MSWARSATAPGDATITTTSPNTDRRPSPRTPIYVEWGGKQFGPFESMEAVAKVFEVVDEPAPRFRQDQPSRPRLAA